MLTLFSTLFVAVWAVVLIGGLLVYVLESVGRMYVLRVMGFSYPVLAWIPLISTIALGLCCDEGDGNVYLHGIPVSNRLLALYPLIAGVLVLLPGVGSFLSVVVTLVFGGLVFSHIYARLRGCTPKDCLVLGVLSAVIGLIPLVLFLYYMITGKADREYRYRY